MSRAYFPGLEQAVMVIGPAVNGAVIGDVLGLLVRTSERPPAVGDENTP